MVLHNLIKRAVTMPLHAGGYDDRGGRGRGPGGWWCSAGEGEGGYGLKNKKIKLEVRGRRKEGRSLATHTCTRVCSRTLTHPPIYTRAFIKLRHDDVAAGGFSFGPGGPGRGGGRRGRGGRGERGGGDEVPGPIQLSRNFSAVCTERTTDGAEFKEGQGLRFDANEWVDDSATSPTTSPPSSPLSAGSEGNGPSIPIPLSVENTGGMTILGADEESELGTTY